MSQNTEPLDPWGMAWVHQVYRREFRLLAQLIAAVEQEDVQRAAVVGDHLAVIVASLNDHHVSEDELLWPLLLQRVELEAGLVHRMAEQHARLHELLEEVGRLTPGWVEKADATDRDRLAAVVAQVSVATEEHLADEETNVMPLVRRYITPDEWQAFELRGHASIPEDKALIFLGLGLQDATPHERAKFTGGLPPEVLGFWAGPGQQQYAQWRADLLGSA